MNAIEEHREAIRKLEAEARAMCCRCGVVRSNEWWNRWPNAGRIRMGFAAQITGALVGLGIGNAKVSHPALRVHTAQDVEFTWGDSTPANGMCSPCQRELLKLLGDFFRVAAPEGGEQ